MIISKLKGYSARIWSVNFSPDAKTIVSGSEDGTVKLWNIYGTLLNTINAGQGIIRAAIFSPVSVATPKGFGNVIVSSGKNKTIKLWNTDGKLITTLQGHKSAVWDVEFTPVSVATPKEFGKNLVSGSEDNTLMLWN